MEPIGTPVGQKKVYIHIIVNFQGLNCIQRTVLRERCPHKRGFHCAGSMNQGIVE